MIIPRGSKGQAKMGLTFGGGVLHYRSLKRRGRLKNLSSTEGKIYCANCAHCVVFKLPIENTKAYVLRVRCSKGVWKKKSGDEKIYKYFSIVRRIMDTCEFYDAMGDEHSFLKELKRSLPIKDEIYTYSSAHTQEVESKEG
jgi:hypothetical protein